MSDFEDEFSPVPGVSFGDTVRTLYEVLDLLHDWVEKELERITQCVEVSGIPPLPAKNPMTLDRFISYIPIQVHYGTFRSIDELRDRYDFLCREFGDRGDWDTSFCLKNRLKLVQDGVNIYRMAFLGAEHTEMRVVQEMERNFPKKGVLIVAQSEI